MAAAFVFVMPIGFGEAAAALSNPWLVLAGIGVGVCSSVIPYVCDQLAMSRLPRNTFALMLALLPATATAIGALVLGQTPTRRDLAGIGLVMAGIAIHRPPAEPVRDPRKDDDPRPGRRCHPSDRQAAASGTGGGGSFRDQQSRAESD